MRWQKVLSHFLSCTFTLILFEYYLTITKVYGCSYDIDHFPIHWFPINTIGALVRMGKGKCKFLQVRFQELLNANFTTSVMHLWLWTSIKSAVELQDDVLFPSQAEIGFVLDLTVQACRFRCFLGYSSRFRWFKATIWYLSYKQLATERRSRHWNSSLPATTSVVPKPSIRWFPTLTFPSHLSKLASADIGWLNVWKSACTLLPCKLEVFKIMADPVFLGHRRCTDESPLKLCLALLWTPTICHLCGKPSPWWSAGATCFIPSVPLFHVVRLSRCCSRANRVVNAAPCAFYVLVMTSRRITPMCPPACRLPTASCKWRHPTSQYTSDCSSECFRVVANDSAIVHSHCGIPSYKLTLWLARSLCRYPTICLSSVSLNAVFPLVDLLSCDKLSCTVPSLNEGLPEIVPTRCTNRHVSHNHSASKSYTL